MVPSLIRTYVPIAVGAVLAWLASRGVNVDDGAAQGLVAFLTALLSALYYAVARLLESRWPQAGWLLGSPKQPTYK